MLLYTLGDCRLRTSRKRKIDLRKRGNLLKRKAQQLQWVAQMCPQRAFVSPLDKLKWFLKQNFKTNEIQILLCIHESFLEAGLIYLLT